MSMQSDAYERRLFTSSEFDKMLDVGILSPDEGAVLDDGFVLIPARPGLVGWPPSRDPGPRNAPVASDEVLAELPAATGILREVSGIVNALNTEIPGGLRRAEVHCR